MLIAHFLYTQHLLESNSVMKVLLSAYACEPELGSEEGVGWNMALAIAQYHEVWVLTRTFSRAAIKTELACHPVPNLHFIYFEPLGWSEDWKNTQGSVQIHYYLWQIQAYFVGRTLHQKVNFDIIQHSTYVKYWSPSFLALLPVPFIWGPVGGGEAAPIAFWKDFSFRGKLYEALRLIAQRLGEYDPFTRLTARRSVLALATTKETAERLRLLQVKRLQLVSQLALSVDEITYFAQCHIISEHIVRFMSIGRLIHWKGIHLGLRAFATAGIENAEYWIIGNGSERQRLEQLAKELKISKQVKFLGSISRDKLKPIIEQCHILVHPSLHDSGGQVCAETMAAQRPVICLDLGGPAYQVTQETGIKVAAHTPEQAIQGLAEAMVQLATNPALQTQMGQAGQKRVREYFAWETKSKLFSKIYQDILFQSKRSTSL
ncbi:glycosyltransferase family 4 protein [Pantanalinema rosaneae CENA516]|uniref:glycosyltransferase family 4 protein n=1 Tax=Pantanalinema rosaneae TaxID=1620701 RepID=UPI003D6EC914